MRVGGIEKRNDEAVSPVIGVILMVAVGVVLSGVVYISVGNMGSDQESLATMAFAASEEKSRITVITAEASANWEDLVLRLESCDQAADNAVIYVGGDTSVNAEATLEGSPLNSAATGASCGSPLQGVELAASQASVYGGDHLSLCYSGGVPGNIYLVLVDTSTNARVGRMQLDSIHACPTPSVYFTGAAGTITATTTAQGFDWADWTVEMSACTQSGLDSLVRLGNSATGSFVGQAIGPDGKAMNTGAWAQECGAPVSAFPISPTSDPIAAGETIHFCDDAYRPDVSDVSMLLTDTVTTETVTVAVGALPPCGTVDVDFAESTTPGTLEVIKTDGDDYWNEYIVTVGCTFEGGSSIGPIRMGDDEYSPAEPNQPATSNGRAVSTSQCGTEAPAGFFHPQAPLVGDELNFCLTDWNPALVPEDVTVFIENQSKGLRWVVPMPSGVPDCPP